MDPDTQVDVVVNYADRTSKVVQDIQYCEITARVGFLPIVSEWIVKVVISRR